MSDERINPGKLWVRLPDGSIANAFEAMDREKLRGEQVINTSLLRPGDLIAMQYTNTEQAKAGFLFKVDEALLLHAGINVGAPEQLIGGRFHGEDLPEPVLKEHFRFTGSGWGGGFKQFGVLVSGRIPAFISDTDRGGQFLSPVIDRYGIYRPDVAGEIRPVSLENLGAEAKKVSFTHEARLERVKTLMKRLGFDANLEDCSGTQATIAYEDSRYLANYEGGMALGNRVVIYDKQTSRWMEFGYFNFREEDCLKVSFADLSGLDFNKVFIRGYILGDSSVLHARVPITTFNTSSSFGLDVINYHPGDKELGEIGIVDYNPTKYRFRGKPSPNVQLFSDGRVVLDSIGFFVPIEESHPGALQLIRDAVGTHFLPDGSLRFTFNGKSINAINPDTEIDALIRSIGQKPGGDFRAPLRAIRGFVASRLRGLKLKIG